MVILHGDRHDCETALELMEVLSPAGKEWVTQEPEWWLFRGQALSWPIIASAFREEANLNDYIGAAKSEPRKYSTQCYLEKAVIQKFFRLADRIGLALPEDSQLLRKDLVDYPEDSFQSWPTPHLLSLMGLAQHYGLPTRLIDWTWNPYVAAYFAATAAKKLLDSGKSEERDRILISGLRAEVANSKFLDTGLNVKIQDFTLDLVTAPTNGNVNLKAQEGVFLLVSPENPEPDFPYDWPDVASLISRSKQIRDEHGMGMVMSFEATLPYKEVGMLLFLLYKIGYSRSRIFPSYDGVVAQIKEEVE